MRLIDADKLETTAVLGVQLQHADSRYYYFYEEETIDKAPTVKAIPIEWIKRYIAEEGIYPNRELLSVEQADAIERMIENWEKENERP